MTQQNNILAAASKSLLLVELKGIGGWSPNARLKDASRVLAETYGGSERAFKGTENLLPAPHDEEYKVLKAAYGDVRSAFYAMTMPFGSSIDVKSGKPRADGKRAITANRIVDGTFLAQMKVLCDALKDARIAFAAALPGRIEAIRNESALGSQFDYERYPSPEKVLSGWTYDEILPEPILDAGAVKNMGLPPEIATAIEDNLARRVESQVQFGQQQLVDETLKYVKTMVTNLTKLNAYFNGQTKGKRPAVFDSLIENVTESLEKLKTYALPGTEQGDAVLQLVSGIEERLDMQEVDASAIKNDAKVAERLLKGATEAGKLIDAWTGTDTTFDEPEQESKPEPKVEATLEVSDALADVLEEEEEVEPVMEMGTQKIPEPEKEPEPADNDDDINDLLAGW